MPNCQHRDRPSDNLTCNTMPNPGKSLCPRHEFMAELKSQQRVSQELAKTTRSSSSPRNRAELLKRGYHFKGESPCRGCNQQIEWYDTPNGKTAPYNQMPLDTSPAVCHFITCTRANQFRKAS